jgi:hypothetical protein
MMLEIIYWLVGLGIYLFGVFFVWEFARTKSLKVFVVGLLWPLALLWVLALLLWEALKALGRWVRYVMEGWHT